MRRATPLLLLTAAFFALAVGEGLGQPEPKKDFFKGFPGGPMGQTRKVVAKFDKDGDGRLNADERQAARESLSKEGGFGKGGFGKGPPGFGKGMAEPTRPGPKVAPADVANFPDSALYEPTVLRTLFFEFENKDWEAELTDFHGTDVEVPATLTVDGKKYPNVGVHFRGMSSYMMVPAGAKRSLNVALDFADPKQRLYGHKTLNLLNSHEDPSLMSTVLYSHIARQYIPAPKANFVKVVINGESWGVYVNAEQFNKEFTKENFKSEKGARWKVSGSPGAAGGLEYLGDNVEDYKRRFEIKTKDDEKSWKALINFCKVLNQTPPDKLEEALKPICDIDGLLWFLALDVALINNDGYWVRSSDYSIYMDDKGKFHFIPHDMNEAFRPAMGPPGMGGPGGGFGGRGGRTGFGGPPPAPGEILPPPVRDALKLTDEQKQKLDVLQKETDDKLAKVLTAEQAKQLKEMRDAGPMMPPFGMPGGGPPMGGFGGGRSGGMDLDPLVGLTDARKPLRSKVLAVPNLRAKYLQDVRTVAEKSLDWNALGPVVGNYRKLIEKEVEADTRKLSSSDEFKRTTADTAAEARGRDMPLRTFAEQRRKYLLDYKEPTGR